MVAAPITASYARHYGRTAGNNGGVDNMIAYIAYACQGTNVGEMGALRQGNGHVTGGVPFVASALRADGFDASEDGTGRQNLIAFDLAQITSAANRTRVAPDLPASTLNGGGAMHVASPMAVRRLTPRECERLQGFPDDHTLVLYRGKLAADGPRYKAIGNSMAVPVMRWIGERIATVLEAT
jgi:site-specific DNA-cytosine methylase